MVRQLSSSRSLLVLLGGAAFGLGGCAQVLGLGDYKDSGSGGGGGTSTTSTGTTGSSTTSTSSSSTGGGMCMPGTTQSCFTGMPPAKAGTGLCVAGMQTCNPDGMGYGTCNGETLPTPETCKDPHDEDCDGNECAVWAKIFGDGADQAISGIAVDSMGNVVVAGVFSGALNFDPATPITANGSQIYLAKLDPQGGHLFSKVFASAGSVSVSGIEIDAQDNIVMTGAFSNNANLNFGSGTLSTINFGAAFAAKFGPAGVSKWSIALDFDDYTNVAPPAIDSMGNVILFGHQECGFSCSNNNLWLEKRPPNGGAAIWHKTFFIDNGTSTRFARGVAVDPFDDIFIAGSYSGSETLGGATFTSTGGYDPLIAKFDPNGALLGKFLFAGAGNQAAVDIASDSSGDMFVLGNFAQTMSFGSKSVMSAGGDDIFLARINANNVVAWIDRFGGVGDDRGNRLRVPKLGLPEVIFTGLSTGAIDLGGGQMGGGGGFDVPLVKIDAMGNHVWSRIFGGALDQGGADLALLGGGRSVLAGNVLGSIDVGTGMLASAGKLDVLVATFAP